jgi:hypothetical protein
MAVSRDRTGKLKDRDFFISRININLGKIFNGNCEIENSNLTVKLIVIEIAGIAGAAGTAFLVQS